jgi:hypothetical protein
MKQGPFEYVVMVELTFTGHDLRVMFDASRRHYDDRCNAASYPARTAGGRVIPGGGEIWGLINTLDGVIPTPQGEQDGLYMRRACEENPDATVTRSFTAREIGLFAKITEPVVMTADNESLVALHFGFRRAMAACSAEHRRVNPETPPAG